jgi:hypothetical protein
MIPCLASSCSNIFFLLDLAIQIRIQVKIQISGSTKGVFVANTTYSRDAFIIVFLDTWYERIVFVLLVILLVIVVCYLLLLDTGTGTGAVYRYAQRFKDIVHTGTVYTWYLPVPVPVHTTLAPNEPREFCAFLGRKHVAAACFHPHIPRFRIPHLFLLV